MRIYPGQLALKPLLMLVELLVVLAQDSVVVDEYSSGEIAKRVLALEVVGEQASLEYPEQAVRLHLFLQVLPIANKVAMAQDMVVKVNEQFAQAFRWLTVFWLVS